MSHFVGAVVIPTGTSVDLKVTPVENWTPHVDANPELEALLEHMLAPFDENKETEPYEIDPTTSEYHDTAEEAISKAVAYAKDKLGEDISGLPKLEILNEHWSEGWIEKEDGSIVETSTYNPDSKWDWYQVGGRWEEAYRDQQGESVEALRALATKNLNAVEQLSGEAGLWGPSKELVLADQKVDYLPYTVVVPRADGTVAWLSKGEMGWFGISSGDVTPQQWAQDILAATEGITDGKVVYVDFHI